MLCCASILSGNRLVKGSVLICIYWVRLCPYGPLSKLGVDTRLWKLHLSCRDQTCVEATWWKRRAVTPSERVCALTKINEKSTFCFQISKVGPFWWHAYKPRWPRLRVCAIIGEGHRLYSFILPPKWVVEAAKREPPLGRAGTSSATKIMSKIKLQDWYFCFPYPNKRHDIKFAQCIVTNCEVTRRVIMLPIVRQEPSHFRCQKSDAVRW